MFKFNKEELDSVLIELGISDKTKFGIAADNFEEMYELFINLKINLPNLWGAIKSSTIGYLWNRYEYYLTLYPYTGDYGISRYEAGMKIISYSRIKALISHKLRARKIGSFKDEVSGSLTNVYVSPLFIEFLKGALEEKQYNQMIKNDGLAQKEVTQRDFFEDFKTIVNEIKHAILSNEEKQDLEEAKIIAEELAEIEDNNEYDYEDYTINSDYSDEDSTLPEITEDENKNENDNMSLEEEIFKLCDNLVEASQENLTIDEVRAILEKMDKKFTKMNSNTDNANSSAPAQETTEENKEVTLPLPKTSFKREELKSGDIIILRDQTVEIAILEKDLLVLPRNFNRISELPQDLTNESAIPGLDVVAVFRTDSEYEIKFDILDRIKIDRNDPRFLYVREGYSKNEEHSFGTLDAWISTLKGTWECPYCAHEVVQKTRYCPMCGTKNISKIKD